MARVWCDSKQLGICVTDIPFVIVSLVGRLLDFVVPRSCAGCDSPVRGSELWCAACSESVVTLPRDVELVTAQGHRLIAPFAYGGPVSSAIFRLKFNNRPELARALGRRLAPELLLAAVPNDAAIVPVPSTAERIVERGYNQAALLASALARAVGLVSIPTALRRSNCAQHQVGANKAQRVQQVAGAFVATRRIKQGSNIILVDDVVTTGATSAACAHAVEVAGAKLVAVVAVARVP
jgi:ComF family protein